MPSYDYNYLPLPNGQKSYTKKYPLLWPTSCAVLIIINLILVWNYVHGGQDTSSSLDNFQKLNNVSVVDLTAFPKTSYPFPDYNPDDHAVVSSLYTDSYATAITTLGHSLRSVNVSARIILMYLPDQVSPHTLCLASAAGWELHAVTFIPPPHNGNGLREYFKDQYTKLNLWTLDTIGIKSLVYLDADTLVRKNFDELLTLPFNFAAVPDVFEDRRGFSIGFNAGVLFLRPSTVVFQDMISKLEMADYPPKFAEQAFLNLYFGAQVVRLPYAYNANLAIKQRSPQLWESLSNDMRIVHYTVEKPFPSTWLHAEELETFFDGRKNIHGGLWGEEMGWWQDAWREMMREAQKPLSLAAHVVSCREWA